MTISPTDDDLIEIYDSLLWELSGLDRRGFPPKSGTTRASVALGSAARRASMSRVEFSRANHGGRAAQTDAFENDLVCFAQALFIYSGSLDHRSVGLASPKRSQVPAAAGIA